MLQRTYKALMRMLLLLIAFQFFVLVLTPNEASELPVQKEYSITAEHAKSFLLSVFYESNKTERESEDEDERLIHGFEIADLSFASFVPDRYYIHTTSVAPVEQQYDLKPPLFKLHHRYII
jgi:hypothetical protein